MARSSKAPILPRKTPKQERSRTLIDSVLEATARVLTTMGYEKATTNRVAELAGISVGSLYQYFPNKDAILASLIERQFALHKEAISRMLAESASDPTEKVIGRVISEIVDLFMDKRSFLKSLLVHLPRLEKTRALLLQRDEIIDLMQEYMRARTGAEPAQIRTALVILTNAVMGVIQTAILSDEQILSRETMKTELAKLAERYLLRS